MKASVGIGAAAALALAALIPVNQASVQHPARTDYHQAAAAPVHAQLTAYSGITVRPGPSHRAHYVRSHRAHYVRSHRAHYVRSHRAHYVRSHRAHYLPSHRAHYVRRTATARGSFAECVIQRESGGNAQARNPAGYWGLYQFSRATWVAYGGNPATYGSASAAEQTRVFNNAMARGGRGNWSPYDGC